MSSRQLSTAAFRYGYVLGPSGGARRTVLCVENVEDVGDGALPFISGVGGGVNFPSLVGNVARVLGPALASLVDANDPGGSRDPFAELTGQQRVELARLYRSGLQPGAEFSWTAAGVVLRGGQRTVGSVAPQAVGGNEIARSRASAAPKRTPRAMRAADAAGSAARSAQGVPAGRTAAGAACSS